ncbi:MAG: hypothetical protein O7B27_12260 [Gammaproteobacteria bacterium]|nr:hypothetical protein [Gammaproteobacteria bacterium]
MSGVIGMVYWLATMTDESQKAELKKQMVGAYFAAWRQDLGKAKELLGKPEYRLTAILVLSCYIAALARLRYPDTDSEREVYTTMLREYSGLKEYEWIDLRFFYQWRSSDHIDKRYRKALEGLENYEQIQKILIKSFGDNDQLAKGQEKDKYKKPAEVVQAVRANQTEGLNQENFEQKLQLFSVGEILYRIVRCNAVHETSFPLINRGQDANGNLLYKEWHIITSDFLYTTVENILSKYEGECMAEGEWPHAYRQ